MAQPITAAEALRARGWTPCRLCKGEGILKARTAMFEQTAICGRCDGDGREPEASDAA